ncbi:hypothetical protein SBP18_05765 [Rhodoferax ferrireducens]|nr:hypothetical protein [Rhodoferax ferrireducens]WPC68019.1 hypothetical protein SBP18_05765 [Rhodoferax ferrireducens]
MPETSIDKDTQPLRTKNEVGIAKDLLASTPALYFVVSKDAD